MIKSLYRQLSFFCTVYYTKRHSPPAIGGGGGDGDNWAAASVNWIAASVSRPIEKENFEAFREGCLRTSKTQHKLKESINDILFNIAPKVHLPTRSLASLLTHSPTHSLIPQVQYLIINACRSHITISAILYTNHYAN
jgi:hypothetical protein